MYSNNGTSKFVDDWDYISYANNILSQGIWVPDISKLYSNSHLVCPGFPLILASLFYIFGEHYLVVILFNALLSTIVVILIFFLGQEIFNRRIGMSAAVLATFYILFFKYIPTVTKEVLILFFFLLTVLLVIKETKRSQITKWSLFPIISYAFFIHVDERYFSYFPIFILSFIFLDNFSYKNGIKKASLFFFIVCMLMVPWLIRNYIVYDNRVVILTENTSRFTDKILGYDPLLSYYGKKKKKYAQFKWDESWIDDILSGKEIPGLKGKRLRRLKPGLQKGYIPHKFNTFEKLKSNFIELWKPVQLKAGYKGSGFHFNDGPWSLKHNMTVGLSYGLLLPFFLLGSFFLIFRYRNKYGVFLLVIISIHTLIHILISGKERYRIPIDPFIILIALYGIDHLYLQFKSKCLMKVT